MGHIRMRTIKDLGHERMKSIKDLLPTSTSAMIDLRDSNKKLGSGSFGRVYKADIATHGKIAVKVLKKENLESLTKSQVDFEINQFYHEAFLLAQLNHPNILRFKIMISDFRDGFPGMATELMSHSLSYCIKNDPGLRTWGSIIDIAQQVADGMAFLHSKGVVHFDLKTSNILVDYSIFAQNRVICKVSDFGLAVEKSFRPPYNGVIFPIYSQRGTVTYMAPEVIQAKYTKWTLVTEKLDVYSFGIMLWELLMGKKAYKGMDHDEIEELVLGGFRPTVPNCCNWRWKDLMEDCWAGKESSRPSFTEISDRLQEIEIQYLKKSQGRRWKKRKVLIHRRRCT